MSEALGEFELIAAIRERIAAAGAAGSARLVIASGDDAAVTADAGASAVSVDAVVEGVHFRRPPFSLRQVGHKALAAGLSDLAAMGATPGEIYVQLGLPDGVDDDGCLELADGLAAVAAAHDAAVAGGDISRSPILFVAVTAVGTAPRPDAFVLRSEARPGDAVVVTGGLGAAAAGLRLLDSPELATGLDEGVASGLRRRQLEPEPRVAAGQALAAAGATAMIDISDGLGGDAAHVAAASGVALRLGLDRVPVAAGVSDLAAAAGLDPLDLVVAGGEDYELLATLPAATVAEAGDAVAATGLALSVIGTVEPGEGVELSEPGGGVRRAAGFDQRRRRERDEPA